MKKLILMLLPVLFLIGCSTQKTEQHNERQQLEIKYKMPTFSSAEVNDFGFEMLRYFLEINEIKKQEGEIDPETIQKKAMDFNEKAAAVKEKMTSEDSRKFTEWSTWLIKEINLESE